VLKQRLWLGLVGLLAGIVLAYLQFRECGRPRKRPPAPTARLAPEGSARRSCPPPAGRPRPTPRATSVARPPSRVQPPAPSLAPRVFVISPIPEVPAILSSVGPADRSVRTKLPLPDDGKLWNAHFDAGLNAADGSGGKLDFAYKKAADDAIPRIQVSNMSEVAAGCRLFKDRRTTFSGQLGGGFSGEFAGLAEGQRIPEMLLGVQLTHQISQRNKVLGAIDYAYDIADFGRQRVRTRVAWEVLLDPDKNLSLRTGILDSANKIPKGERVNNLDYSLDVIWKF
jgi:hypothetical protein